MSLLQRLAALQLGSRARGFLGLEPKSVMSSVGQGSKTAGGFQEMPQFGDDPLEAMKWAINNRQSVNFRYVDKWREPREPGAKGPRIGNPHALWVGRNGTLYLHMWIDPSSASASASDGTGRKPGWRTFIVSRIDEAAVRDAGFSQWTATRNTFNIAPGWNPAWYSQVGQPVALVKR